MIEGENQRFARGVRQFWPRLRQNAALRSRRPPASAIVSGRARPCAVDASSNLGLSGGESRHFPRGALEKEAKSKWSHGQFKPGHSQVQGKPAQGTADASQVPPESRQVHPRDTQVRPKAGHTTPEGVGNGCQTTPKLPQTHFSHGPAMPLAGQVSPKACPLRAKPHPCHGKPPKSPRSHAQRKARHGRCKPNCTEVTTGSPK